MSLAWSCGKIASMAQPTQDAKLLLREDLSKEYYALLDVVSSYDGWLLIVKGWSVTLSLAALGLGFQQRHYALFFLAAVTGAAFWLLDGLMKGFQYRYYVRMREIEYTAYLINRVRFDSSKYGDSEISAPRIDMTWDFKGYPVDEKGNPKELPPSTWWRRMLGLPKKSRASGDPGANASEDPDYRASEPWRRKPQEIYWAMRHRFGWGNV